MLIIEKYKKIFRSPTVGSGVSTKPRSSVGATHSIKRYRCKHRFSANHSPLFGSVLKMPVQPSQHLWYRLLQGKMTIPTTSPPNLAATITCYKPTRHALSEQFYVILALSFCRASSSSVLPVVDAGPSIFCSSL